MIFGFKSPLLNFKSKKIQGQDGIDHSRVIDISLQKLSRLQLMGKLRSERQIVMVLDILQWALYTKSIKDYGKLNITDLVYYFEQEIYSAMNRQAIDRLPRLWIDLPSYGKGNGKDQVQSKFKIKASFTKKTISTK